MYFRVFWNQRAVSVTQRRPVAAEPEHVPVREGVYGDRVAAVEPGGIELIHWITPFLAVVPLDYWLRRGDYAEREFFDRRRQRWRAPLAMAAGIAASVPFWDQGHPIPVGWFPKHYPQIGDLSFFVGFTVTAVIYLALNERAVRRRLVSP